MTLKVEGKARVAECREEAELKAHVCGRMRMGTDAPGRGAVYMRLVGKETSVPSEHCSNGEHSQVCVVSPERGCVLRLGGSLAASPAEPPSHSGGCHFPATALYVTLSESDPHCHRLYVCPEDDCHGLVCQGFGSLGQGPYSTLFLSIPRRCKLQLSTVVARMIMCPFGLASLSCLLPPTHLS